jgi:transcriptional regulator with XRE-family HTH domain
LRESATDFGVRLRAQRERRGLTLDQVAASTKIKTSLLSGLERNDLSRWPKGIYGRAFVRAYADAIGCSEESLVDEVLQHFRAPDEVAASAGETDSVAADAGSPLRLTLDAEVVPTRHTATHAIDAILTLAAVLGVAALVGTAVQVSFLSAAAVIALVWYPVAHALCGGFSPTRVVTKHRRSVAAGVPPAEAGRQAFVEYQVTN